MSAQAILDTYHLEETCEAVLLQCQRNGIPEVSPEVVAEAEVYGEPLGEGASGSCYLLPDRNGFPLCVKVLRTGSRGIGSLWETLLEEAMQMVRVADVPGMVRLVGVSLLPSPAVAMLYAGESLMDLLIDAKVTPDEALGVMTQVVATTAELTRRNLCHADLKTDNIVVSPEQGFKATVVDLGMMRQFGYNPGWKGKSPRCFYAPELYRGSPLSPETQVYQVGKVMQETLKETANTDAILNELARDASSMEAASRPTIDALLDRMSPTGG